MRTLAFLFAALFSAVAQAQSQSALPVPRYPTESCGAHLANMRDPVQHTTMGSYVRGFLSGMNHFRTDGKRSYMLDDEGISILIEKHCKKNLLMKVDEAVMQIAQELAR